MQAFVRISEEKNLESHPTVICDAMTKIATQIAAVYPEYRVKRTWYHITRTWTAGYLLAVTGQKYWLGFIPVPMTEVVFVLAGAVDNGTMEVDVCEGALFAARQHLYAAAAELEINLAVKTNSKPWYEPHVQDGT